MNSSTSFNNISSSLSNQDIIGASTKTGIAIALGLVINYMNGLLIHTFRKHQIFNTNPRYILFIHLVVNDVIQLITSISLFFFSYVLNKLNASFCCLIITFSVFTTMNTPLNLAAMAVECYIAVCFPLRHAELCTIKRTYIVIGCIWGFSALSIIPDIFIIMATEPMRLFFSAIFCDRDTLFRHPLSLQKRDMSYLICLTVVWLTLFFTYFRIFFTAQAANSADGNAKKARNTILLHSFQLLLSMLTFVDPIIKGSLMLLFPQYFAHLRFVWYVTVHIVPRFVSPIVYGLRDKMFKQYFKKYLLCDIRAGNELNPLGKLL